MRRFALSPLSVTLAIVLTVVVPQQASGPAAQQPPAPQAPQTAAATVKPPVTVPLDIFQVPAGLEITLWAASPLLHNPTNIDMVAEDVYLAYLPFFHVNTQSWAMWSTLGVGGTVVLQPKFSSRATVARTDAAARTMMIPSRATMRGLAQNSGRKVAR